MSFLEKKLKIYNLKVLICDINFKHLAEFQADTDVSEFHQCRLVHVLVRY